jgi:hypothetical protein
MRYATGYITGAAFVDRDKFDRVIEQCVLLASSARLHADKGRPTAGMAPDFTRMAYEIRGAIARVCNREIIVKSWPELTPDEGTHGVSHYQMGEHTIEEAKANA